MRVQGDASSGVEDRGVGVRDEVGGDDLVLGVGQDSLHRSLGSSLDNLKNNYCILFQKESSCFLPAPGDQGRGIKIGKRANLLDVVEAGGLLEAAGEIDDGHIGSGHTESHSGEFSVEGGDDFSDGFGSSSAGGDDVLGGTTAIAPQLSGWTVDGLLGGGDGVYSGHQTLDDTEVVVDDLGQGSQAVGGAGGVTERRHLERPGELDEPDDVVVGGAVLLVVDSHDEHRGIGRGSGDDDLLGASLQMGSGLLDGGEDSSRLDHVVGSGGSPLDLGGVLAEMRRLP